MTALDLAQRYNISLRHRRSPPDWNIPQRLLRPLFVVVGQILAAQEIQMPSAKDHEVIQLFKMDGKLCYRNNHNPAEGEGTVIQFIMNRLSQEHFTTSNNNPADWALIIQVALEAQSFSALLMLLIRLKHTRSLLTRMRRQVQPIHLR